MRSTLLIAALTACQAHPHGVELQFEPIAPGADHIDLYLGTTMVNVPSLVAPGNASVEATTAYARDTPLPHGLDLVGRDELVDVEASAGFPAVGALIAVEYDLAGNEIAGAALTGISASSEGVTRYKVPLKKITASEPIVDAWSPVASTTAPTGFHGDDSCAYYSDANTTLLLVVTRLTGTAVNGAFATGGYADFDCDGYDAKSDLECNDTIYDSLGGPPSLDSAICLEEFSKNGPTRCRATGPTCIDGQKPETTCPDPNSLMASNLASYCLPDSECTMCSNYPTGRGLDCLTSGFGGPYTTCDVAADVNLNICDGVMPTLMIPNPTGMVLTCDSNGIIPYATVGLPGQGFDTSLTIGHMTITPTVDAATCDQVVFDLTGTWDATSRTVTFLLALTPNTGLGMLLPIAFDLPPDQIVCPASNMGLACDPPMIGDDDSVTQCVQNN